MKADGTLKPSGEGVEANVELVDEIKPLIPGGEYSAQYMFHQTAKAFGEPRVYVYFRIVTPGPYFGVELYRAYRVFSFSGKPKKNGGFKVKSRSELFITLCTLFDGHKDFRPDRLSLNSLKNCIIRVKVRLVEKDYLQRPLPMCLRYSVIDSMVEIEAGSLK